MKKYYKLTMRWGGGEKEDVSVDYFDDLNDMCDEIWHHGEKDYPCFEEAEEITEEEYRLHELPI